ncbi:MAG: TraR/DksA family transcriptional regulator [Lentisphaerae bacterium]|nr:TraR/DksA family transcriptional regulator [Lentisphaerota bacterium]
MRKSRSQAKTVFTGELMTEFRELLLRERSSLVRQIKSLSDASLTSSRQAGEELADVGSDDFIRETELYLLSEEGRRLALINLALESLAAGTYGICVDCDKPIALGRLRAKPYARLCIDCKVVREKNDGAAPDDRDDDSPVED